MRRVGKLDSDENNGENMARIMTGFWRDWRREYGENLHPRMLLIGRGLRGIQEALAPLLSGVRLRQGLLLGKMRGYGLASRWTATLKVLTEETIKSSAIEGVVLDPENVRSSLARRLGLRHWWAQRPQGSKCRWCR